MKLHDRMVSLVEEMLDLHKRLHAAKSDAEKERLGHAIKATDRKIDSLVYELYSFTDEEIIAELEDKLYARLTGG